MVFSLLLADHLSFANVLSQLVSESGVEQEVVVLSDQSVLAALEEPIEKVRGSNMQLFGPPVFHRWATSRA